MIAKTLSPAEAAKDARADGARPRLAGGAGAKELELRRLTLHGHRVAYRHAGSGPVIVLIHGITSSSDTWTRVMPT